MGKLQSLNYYVKVDNKLCGKELPLTKDEFIKEGLDKYDVMIVTDWNLENHRKLNDLCRNFKIKFISCQVRGVSTFLFQDFGKEFLIYDKDGEECKELMINNITTAKEGVVSLVGSMLHGL